MTPVDAPGRGELGADSRHWRRSMALLRPFFARNWAALAGASGATVLATAATLAQPWPLALVIDQLIGVHDGAFELSGADVTFLALVTGLVLAIALVMAASEYFTDLWLTRAGERIVHDLRVALYIHLQRLSLAFHNRQQKGDLVTRVTGDVNAVGTLFSESLGEIVAAVLLLIGMAIVTLVLDPLLALATFAVVPLLFAVTVYYGRRVKSLARRQRKQEGQIASLAAETLAAMQVVKAFGSEDYESDRVASRSAERQDLGIEAAKAEARFSGLVEIIGAVARALVLVLGVLRVAAGAISPGDLIVFVTYANKTYRPLRDIARQATKSSRALARADRVADVLAADHVLEERSGSFAAGRAAGDVALERVSFHYSPDRPALTDLSLRVPAGSRVALVGPSGAGKSTVGALVARLYDPEAGSVLIDGRDARECSLPWLRDQVGFLLQETMLFAGSVAENIEYAAERRLARGGHRGRKGGGRAGVHRPPPRRLRHPARSLRDGAVRRPAPADRDRARPASRPGDPDPRRADHRPRRGERGRADGRARSSDAGTNHLRDHAFDRARAPRRAGGGDRRRPRGRGRPARAAPRGAADLP